MAALTAIHNFLKAEIPLVGDIAPVGKHTVLVVYALLGIAFVVIELILILVELVMNGMMEQIIYKFCL